MDFCLGCKSRRPLFNSQKHFNISNYRFLFFFYINVLNFTFVSSCVIANVRGLVTKGKLSKDKADRTLSLLKGVLDYSEFRDVDMVIEVGCLKSHLFTVIFILHFGESCSFQ